MFAPAPSLQDILTAPVPPPRLLGSLPPFLPSISITCHLLGRLLLFSRPRKNYTIGVEIIAKLIPQTILLCNVIDYANLINSVQNLYM